MMIMIIKIILFAITFTWQRVQEKQNILDFQVGIEPTTTVMPVECFNLHSFKNSFILCQANILTSFQVIIKCNTKVAMETIGEARHLMTKSKMAERRFASSYEIVVDQL